MGNNLMLKMRSGIKGDQNRSVVTKREEPKRWQTGFARFVLGNRLSDRDEVSALAGRRVLHHCAERVIAVNTLRQSLCKSELRQASLCHPCRGFSHFSERRRVHVHGD